MVEKITFFLRCVPLIVMARREVVLLSCEHGFLPFAGVSLQFGCLLAYIILSTYFY